MNMRIKRSNESVDERNKRLQLDRVRHMTKRKHSKTVTMCNECKYNTLKTKEEIYAGLMYCLKLRCQQELQQELRTHVSINHVNTGVHETMNESHEHHPTGYQNNVRNRQCNYLLLPIGLRCNMDGYIIERTTYFDVGECNLECFYCGGRGWYKENRGSRTTPYFGQLCCSHGKIDLEPLPKLPDDLNILFTESLPPVNSTNSVQNYFLKHIRLLNAGLAISSLQLNDSSSSSTVPCAMKTHSKSIVEGVQC